MAKSEIGYQCSHEECGKWFVKQETLRRHKKSHSQQERNFRCSYEGCKEAYFRNQHLQRHIKRVHQRIVATGVFKCPEDGCTVSFDTKLSLQNHARIKHSDPTLSKLLCSFCPKVFYKKWQVKEHQAVHTNLSPFKCPLCEESFKTYHDFKRHTKVAHASPSSKKVHTCLEKDCGLVFEKWSSLVEHRKKSHSSTVCPKCNKIYDKWRIKAHLKIHDETREVFECTVEGCPRYYFFPKNLKQHVKSAHEGKGHICDICNRKLSTKQKLLEHKKTWHKRMLKQLKIEPEKEMESEIVELNK